MSTQFSSPRNNDGGQKYGMFNCVYNGVVVDCADMVNTACEMASKKMAIREKLRR